MARITVEDCLQKVSNRFLLVHLAARRVIQLRKGAKVLADAPKNKEVVLALREIAAGEINFDNIYRFEQLTTPERPALETTQVESPAQEEALPPSESQEEAAVDTEAGEQEDLTEKSPE